MMLVGTISSLYRNNPQDGNGGSGMSIFADATMSVTAQPVAGKPRATGTTSEIGVQTDSLLNMFRSLIGIKRTGVVVEKTTSQVPSLDSLDLGLIFHIMG